MSVSRLAKVRTGSIFGLDTQLVSVEADLAVGLPAFNLVGLPGGAVRESKERVRSAIINSGLKFPLSRITVNLSPADTHKDGSHFDLPVALAILAAANEDDLEDLHDFGILSKLSGVNELENTAFFGELSLDGSICKMDLAMAMVLGLAEKGITNMFLPAANLREVIEIPGLHFYPVSHIRELISHFADGEQIRPVTDKDWIQVYALYGENEVLTDENDKNDRGYDCEDFFDVKGQESVKRALQIAAAGRHDISLVGPPGIGKSMLAKRIIGIMPDMNELESKEVTRIHNIAGVTQGQKGGLIRKRPFRTPHHSVTQAALMGGGNRLRPGELSLAHRGVLFLDELPEFDRRTLDMLRQPLENRYIDLSRVGFKGRYPCSFLLIAAMNPCPCGYFGDPNHECICTETQRQKYFGKVSGPLHDRIDIHVSVGAVKIEDAEIGVSGVSEEENVRICSSTEEMRAGVIKADTAQRERQGDVHNAHLSVAQVKGFCRGDTLAEDLLRTAYVSFSLSMRAESKIRKVARTIADIEGHETITAEDMSEAISYNRGNNFGRSVG
ncbi:MAG: YifB family Mg chelatase-like AAA ATPase [Clostridiales Family XIII bacterium]|jgi:magnesium chelatase family protein|nr:YifB family Mg chelatase-like AAA ATPase [Clostridiales Family XIII bacterium]